MAIEAMIHTLFTFALLFSSVHAATFVVKNNCPQTIWPATLTSGSGQSQLSTTGFQLLSGASRSVDVPAPWTGRIWARTRCFVDSSSRFSCETGDCASGSISCNGAGGIPPATLAEFTLAPNGGMDFYDVSLVDGFNLPASIATVGGTGECQSTACSANVNGVCPTELQVRSGDGSVIGCKSACLAFNEPQYCCTAEFNDPSKCAHSQYSLIFKNQCPQAYSYAYDDKTSTFTCSGSPNYVVTFCP
ncbi:thaumatin-like protein 1b isoform X2 [Momordica charantia]|uniref:Thaumatin-like protein 1b isoform X2 n=1 Tax=Momordica charantia TaxID=3673 RepID=A0A6J1DYD8_MOMCH|nr:thaumatin-like protein 1b isoform X2 [Momordica charantia]